VSSLQLDVDLRPGFLGAITSANEAVEGEHTAAKNDDDNNHDDDYNSHLNRSPSK
jgi:hypothetical protein